MKRKRFTLWVSEWCGTNGMAIYEGTQKACEKMMVSLLFDHECRLKDAMIV